MPRDFASMTRFSTWSLMPRPWRPPSAFAARNSSTSEPKRLPLSATGTPCSHVTVTVSASTFTSGFQNATPMMGWTTFIDLSRCSRSFASCVAPSMFASVLYAFSALIEYGRPSASRNFDISSRPPSSFTKFTSSHGL